MQPILQDRRNQIIKKATLCIVGVALAIFVGNKIYPLIHGPELAITGMVNGSHLTEPVLHISGVAHFTKDLSINGAPLSTEPDGSFDERFILNPGYNIVTMEGRDRFGNSTIKNYAVILTEEPDRTFTLNVTTPTLSTN